MDKLSQLLSDFGILSLSFYEVEGLCKYIKCFDRAAAVTFFLRVSSSYELKIPGSFHTTRLKARGAIPVVDTSGECAPIILEKVPIQEAYPQIYFSTEAARFKKLYEQIRRVGGCFQRLDARPLIEAADILCELRPDFSLDWFESQGEHVAAASLYIICPLEVFYEKRAAFSPWLLKIEQGLAKVMDEARAANLKFITGARLIKTLVAANVSLEKLKGDTRAAQKLSERALAEYRRAEVQIKDKLEEFRGRSDHEAIVARGALEKKAQAVGQLVLKEITTIQRRAQSLKTAYLEFDEACHQLARAATNLIETEALFKDKTANN